MPCTYMTTLLLLVGCAADKGDPTGDDTGQALDDTAEDTALTDSGDSGDSGDSDDTGTGAGDGFGVIAGDCGVLDATELDSASPWLFRNSIDFGDAVFDPALLSEGAQEIYDEGTLGGSSGESEAVAFDVLYRCEAAALLKSETEIVYDDDGGKKTDILVEIDATKLGVSVTRAYVYPPEDPYTVELATELLEKKLAGIIESSENVSDADAWSKQILSVVAYAPEHADSVEAAWSLLAAELTADTIVYVTVTDGEDEFIY